MDNAKSTNRIKGDSHMTHKKRSPAIDISELEQAWVDQWGEAVKKTTAAKILDVSPATIWRMVQDGRLAEAPNGRILVRQMARWALRAAS